MFDLVGQFTKDDSGATAIEYGFVAALASLAIVGAVTSMGDTLSTYFNSLTSTVQQAGCDGAGYNCGS